MRKQKEVEAMRVFLAFLFGALLLGASTGCRSFGEARDCWRQDSSLAGNEGERSGAAAPGPDTFSLAGPIGRSGSGVAGSEGATPAPAAPLRGAVVTAEDRCYRAGAPGGGDPFDMGGNDVAQTWFWEREPSCSAFGVEAERAPCGSSLERLERAAGYR